MGSHCHSHNHDSSRNIGKAFWLNFFFVIIEFIGGTLTGSAAIIADAVHDLGDTLSLGLAWYLQKFSLKKSTENYSYGYQRFSLLSSLVSGVVIICGSSFVLVSTLSNFNQKQLPNAEGMLLLALLGVLINGIAAWKLSKGQSMNEQMLKWHLIEDLVGWVAVLIGSIAILIYKVTWIDPLLAIVLSVFIIWNVSKQLIKTFKVLLQSTPENFDPKMLKKEIISLPEISDVHDIHSWSLDGQYHVLSLHVVCNLNHEEKEKSLAPIKKEIRSIIKKHGHYHVTIELEFIDEDCPHKDEEGPEHFLV